MPSFFKIVFCCVFSRSTDNDDATKRKVNLVFEKIQTLKSRAAGSTQGNNQVRRSLVLCRGHFTWSMAGRLLSSVCTFGCSRKWGVFHVVGSTKDGTACFHCW